MTIARLSCMRTGASRSLVFSLPLNSVPRFLIAAALLGVFAPSPLPAAPALRVAIEQNNPPLVQLDEQGRPTGFMIDLLREISRVSGVEMIPVPGYWRDHFIAFEARRLDVLGNLADTPTNRAELGLSVGHARMHAVVYTRPDRRPLQRTADFAGKTIATVTGTAANVRLLLLQPTLKAKVVSFPSWQAAFAATERGECDATLFSNQLYPAASDSNNLTRHFVEDMFFAYHFAVHTDDAPTLALLNESLAQLMRNGEFDRLYAKWIGPIEPRQIRFADLKPYLLPLLLGIAAIVAFILWQRYLLRRLRDHTKALHASEQRWRFALDGSGVAVWDWDLAQDHAFYSSVWKRMFGYADDEVGATPEAAKRLVHPDDLPKFQTALATHQRQSDQPFLVEHRMRCRNDTWKWVLNRGMVVDRDTHGRATRMIGTCADLTLRKQAEEDRLVLGKLESTGILAGGIAHDFNNLLTTMFLNVDMALWSESNSANVTKHLNAIKKAATAAHHLTQQLITFARGGDPVRRPTSLREVVQESTQLALSGSTLAARYDFPPDLWPAEVDVGQIGQVIRNLVLNAREAMTAAGTLTLRARNLTLDANAVRGLPAGRYVCLSVADTGTGIPPELLLRIFDPYFSTKQRGEQKGMGLGLTICLSVVTRHHGTITAESTVGQGTTFHIYLPAAVSAATDSPAAPAPAASTTEKHRGRLLVMDDDAGVRFGLVACLQQLGYLVDETEDGQAAIDAYVRARERQEPFDLVILDLTVRGAMGGLEALKGIQQIDPDAAATVISGYADNEVLRDYRRYGFRSAIAKPFTIDTLRQALAEAQSSPAPTRSN
jgi:PAS domain S-box-containing protein